ncbi:unnamed protein product [Durusdinium trenchii]|uniref:Uncharacterized protein n=2 Tax=Durusdinium trenchii TaxID=1381693 RepID=A0ABP0P5E0_9DINO
MAASLSLAKDKKPAAYGNIMRRMTSRVNQLHDELALESVTNIEFEQSSRRSFEFLQGQVRTLKEAFNTLTDTILEEIDFLSGTVRGELWRLDERQTGFEKALVRDCHDQQLRQQQQGQQVHQQSQQLQQHSQQLQQHAQQIQQHSQQLTQQTQQCQQQSHKMQQQAAQLHQMSTQIQQQLQQSQQVSQQMTQQSQQLQTQQIQLPQQVTQQLQQQLQHQFTLQIQQELAKHSQTMKDTMKEEIASLTSRFQDLQLQQEKASQSSQQIQQMQLDLQRHQTSFADLEKRAELMAQDLDTVLQVVPKVEDTMLKTTGHLQERISSAAMDVSKLNDAVAVDRMKLSGTTERLEGRMKSLESDLREELEQKHLKLQRSITRQLESMSRALIESDRAMPGMPMQPDVGFMGTGQRQVDFDMPGMERLDPMQQSMQSGFGTSRVQ